MKLPYWTPSTCWMLIIYQSGMMVRIQATTQDVSTPAVETMYDKETHNFIGKLQLVVAEVSVMMTEVYTLMALIKAKVSHKQFLNIMHTVSLPLTNVQVVDSTKSKAELKLNDLRVKYYMPQKVAQCSLATQLLAALVRQTMQNETSYSKKLISHDPVQHRLWFVYTERSKESFQASDK